jgi:hypothetical protein
MNVKNLSVQVDSLLVANQVKGDFEVREEALQNTSKKLKNCFDISTNTTSNKFLEVKTKRPMH